MACVLSLILQKYSPANWNYFESLSIASALTQPKHHTLVTHVFNQIYGYKRIQGAL